jgi:hypothetical protein
MTRNGSAKKMKITTVLFALVLTASLYAGARPPKKEIGNTPIVHGTDADSMRLEGEQRFHANCGRCHAAPQKFPPRVMGTVLRHMRVRATITARCA